MGYAIFTVRKLALRSRINMANAQLMILSQQQMSLATQKTDVQVQQSTAEAASALSSASKRRSALDNYVNSDGTMKERASTNSEDFQNAVTAATLVTDEDDARSKLEQVQYEDKIGQIASAENAIEIQKKALETEVQVYQAEYEMVEKAETAEIKDSAPKYNHTAG